MKYLYITAYFVFVMPIALLWLLIVLLVDRLIMGQWFISTKNAAE